MKMSGLGGRLAAPPVKQPAKAKLLVALPPGSHVPVADADNLRRLPPGDLLWPRLAKLLPVLSSPAPSRPSCRKPCCARSSPHRLQSGQDHLLLNPTHHRAND